MFEDLLNSFKEVNSVFLKHNKKLYLVGGALRNRLLNLPAGDFDFTTDALPQEVQTFFRTVIPTGIKHGTVTVVYRGQNLEITTFRQDGNYSDARRPDQVSFNATLNEDLQRRDFTINALALDLTTGELIDQVGGLQDLENKTIRAIGKASLRFQEDALRILRLYRFQAQLNFSLDKTTRQAASELKSNLSHLSKERLREEFSKLLTAPKASLGWEALEDEEILKTLFPSWEGIKLTSQERKFLDLVSPDLESRLFYTCFSSCKNTATVNYWDENLRNLTFSNQIRQDFLKLWNFFVGLKNSFNSQKPINLEYVLKELLNAYGKKEGPRELMQVLSTSEVLLYTPAISNWLAVLDHIKEDNQPIFIHELAIGGNQLVKMGIKGKDIGIILKRLQKKIWGEPELNQEEQLLQIVKNNI